MDGARNFAIAHLSSPEISLSASHRISLGLGYCITEWLEPAFKELMLTPACRLTVEDFTLLGIPVLHLIMAMQARIRCLRLAIAYNPKPYKHDFTCKHAGCQTNWEIAWWDRLARHYLHPDFPTHPQETLEKLESNPIIGVTEACWLHVDESIKEQKVFEHEDDIVDDALNRLKTFEGSRTVDV